MKILYLLGSADVGGTERQVLGLAQELAIDNEVTVALLRFEGELLEAYKASGAQLVDLGIHSGSKKKSILKGILAFRSLIKSGNFELLHMYLPESVILGYVVVKTIAKKPPIIAGVRGSMWKRGKFTYFIYKFCLRRFDKVVCNSDELRVTCLDEYKISKHKIQVISNGVTLNSISNDKDYSEIRAVYVANFHSYKGHEILVKAIQEIRSNITLRLMGEGDTLREVKDMALDYGLDEKIYFLGRIDPTESYQWANLMIHPSETEGMSNSILEGMSWGLPGIAFDVGGNSELVKSHFNGLLVREKSPNALANAIEGLSREQLENMGKNSFKKSQNYSWKNLGKKHFELYSKCLEKKLIN